MTSLSRIHLPAAPLLDAIEARDRVAGPLHRLPDWRRWSKAISRARICGTVTASAADVMAVRLCGLTLDEIYGPDWNEAEAVPA